MIYKLKTILLAVFVLSINTQIIANSIVAIVNDDIITMDSISGQIESESTKEEKLELVNFQIDLSLQMQKVSDAGLKPSPEKIDNTLKQIALQNNLTIEQLKSLPQFNEIVEKISQQLSLKALKDFSLKGVDVKPTKESIDIELLANPSPKKFIRQIRISQIIVSEIDSTENSANLDDLLKQKLLNLTEKIQQGSSFSDIAKLHSQSPSYINGGLTDWLEFDKLPELYKEILTNLSKDEISKPFKINNNWHIIKISDDRSFDPHIKIITDKLTKKNIDKYYRDWVKDLRKEAYIEIFEDKF